MKYRDSAESAVSAGLSLEMRIMLSVLRSVAAHESVKISETSHYFLLMMFQVGRLFVLFFFMCSGSAFLTDVHLVEL